MEPPPHRNHCGARVQLSCGSLRGTPWYGVGGKERQTYPSRRASAAVVAGISTMKPPQGSRSPDKSAANSAVPSRAKDQVGCVRYASSSLSTAQLKISTRKGRFDNQQQVGSTCPCQRWRRARTDSCVACHPLHPRTMRSSSAAGRSGRRSRGWAVSSVSTWRSWTREELCGN